MKEILVSVVVVSYNSSEYILDCLESIKDQDYKNLELIITDDYSQDDTIIIAKYWIANNSDRFINVRIIESSSNTGVAPNCNRGLNLVCGSWAKFIAADDMLVRPDSITTYVENIPDNEFVCAIFSDIYRLKFDTYTKIITAYRNLVFSDKISAKEQLKIISKENILFAASAFLNINAICKIGGWDEDINMFEDVTMWNSLLKFGYIFTYVDEPLVVYRFNTESLTQKGKKKINKELIRQRILIFEKYKIPAQSVWYRMYYSICVFILKMVNKSKCDFISRILLDLHRLIYHAGNKPYFIVKILINKYHYRK
ncbi:glycosyltransferase family 2 protein [Bacteroides sp.]|jgi:hypothetical protein|uniref:glycosyltransferase family 2 protein n=1 Tax=Bacteroides sp. TaxID=29523 RepID=UPI0025BCE9C3|nr:glycosyltransferase family 2 protein [Bacteroides sp.]